MKNQGNRRRFLNVSSGVLALAFVFSTFTLAQPTPGFSRFPGTLAQISAGTWDVWGLSRSQEIYRFNGVGFVHVPGRLVRIAAGGGTEGLCPACAPDQVWGINAAQDIYRYNRSTRLFEQISGKLVQVAVGKAGVWGLDASRQIFRFDPNTQAFEQIPGSLVQVAVGNTEVWGLNASREIYKFDLATQRFAQVPGSFVQIRVAGSARCPDTAWGINASQEIYKFDGDGFYQIPGSLVELHLGPDGGGVWGTNAHQEVYKSGGSCVHNPYGEGFTPVPGQLVQIAPSNVSGVWGLNALGQVFRYVAPSSPLRPPSLSHPVSAR